MSSQKKISEADNSSTLMGVDETPVEKEALRKGKRKKKTPTESTKTPIERPRREQRKPVIYDDNSEKESSSVSSKGKKQTRNVRESARQIKLRRQAAQQRQKASRLNESEEHRRIRLEKDRERHRLSRMNLTPEQKMAQRQADRERKVVMRAKETDSERQKRLKMDRDRQIISRLKKNIAVMEIPIEYLTADVTITESEVEFQASESVKIEEPDSTQTIECSQENITVPEKSQPDTDEENAPTSTSGADTSEEKRHIKLFNYYKLQHNVP